MLGLRCIENIGSAAVKIIELLQLGKIEQGSLTNDSKYKSLQGRWFGEKKNFPKKDDNKNLEEKKLHIKRDSLVKIRCKWNKTESLKYYRVLSIFSKYYNKWYVHWESDFVIFDKDSKNYKFLVRMIQLDEGDVKEIDLKKNGL